MKFLELGSGLERYPSLHRLLKNGPVLQQQISTIICCVLVGISAWTLGQLAWFIEPAEQSTISWIASPSSPQRQQSLLDVSSLQKSNMFGSYNQTQPVVKAAVVQDAPKTRLNLVLVGVVASSNPNLSLAVIANRGQQATYGVNEEVEGTRAKLKAVFVDRVIIDNSGRDETLMLEGLEYKRLNVSAPALLPASSVIGNNPGTRGDKLAEIKNALERDPQQIFQYVRLSQVKRDGKVLGYRVSPGIEPELFNSVGLQSGDIATGLNGQDLTDPAAMSNIFKTISDLTELNLTVERDGQRHDVYIEF